MGAFSDGSYGSDRVGGGYGGGHGPAGGVGGGGRGDSGGEGSDNEPSYESGRYIGSVPRVQVKENQVSYNEDRRDNLSLLGTVAGSLSGLPGGGKFGGWAGGQLADSTKGPETGIAESWTGSAFGAPDPNASGGFGPGTTIGQGGFGSGPGGGEGRDIGGMPDFSGVYQGGNDPRSAGQKEMDRQNAFLQYAGGLYHPGLQRGEQASAELYDYYSGNQQPMQDRVNQSVMNSPFLAQNIKQGEDAIARNRQATGGFRSGTTQENLAQNSQNQYQNLYNQQLQQNLRGLGGFGDMGANQLNNYSNFGRGMINDIGSTSGNIQSQKIAEKANDQNFLSGIIGGIASGVGSYFS